MLLPYHSFSSCLLAVITSFAEPCGSITDPGKKCPLLKLASCESCGESRDQNRDGNGYPISEIRRIFTLLGYGYGLISILVGFLMGDNLYPVGTRARVWDRSTRTRKPTDFFNPT
jgi:hypothetical protein